MGINLTEFNVSSLHRDQLRLLLKQGGSAPGFSPDDGTGKTEIYRVENFELAPVDPAAHGMFFGGDSYVIKYTYTVNGREKYIIYFWQVCDIYRNSTKSVKRDEENEILLYIVYSI